MKLAPAVQVALTALALLGPGAVHAHEADLISVRAVRDDASPERVRETLTLNPDTLRRLLPDLPPGSDPAAARSSFLEARRADLEARVWRRVPLSAGGAACVLEASRASWDAGPRVELHADFRCPPGTLQQTFGVLDELPAGYRMIRAGLRDDGASPGAGFADREHPTLSLEGPEGAAGGFAGWVGLGVRHILEGVDHLLFLVAVLLVGGSFRRMLALVTSFTLAHSLTLGLTALGWVTLEARGTRWAEAAIAASLVYMALENLVLKRHGHRAGLTFLFGLVHGLGFASGLRGYGLEEAMVPGLLGFNLGVEVGQAVVMAFLVPVLRIVQRRPRLHSRVMRVSSIGLAGIGLYWMVARGAG
ncbi:HupE/UreJ family protein [Corallococcus sp. BB11-1]|uniref:HupE/UreJ family protein n=1 Tax=Corallococcus sp. BB11-1 TaxID=2996783 RepID=UPI0022711597|nr:HupE/UreJ family protein [Corallococcus sp. BB11-1]MCY1033694.1 HupE/UreJ family protein [Corallococcus sp. BB11-1]